MTPDEIHAKAVAEVAAIFRGGTGVSYLFEQMVQLATKRINAEELQSAPRCPTGGRHNEYETCDICDRK